jgi:transcriptional regulator with XRE-family HTH domain
MRAVSHVSPRAAFGGRVRTLREARGWSQEWLAEVAGVHRTYVSSLERGHRNVSIEIIVRLADALGVPAASLFQEWG